MADLSKWHVLVVEDEKDAQEVIVTLLRPHHMSITTASSGEGALEKLKGPKRPTLALIDLALPGIDGWAVLEAMRADPALAKIPACAMTAYHSTVVAQEAIQAGFAAYFAKPISARTFVEHLANIVG